MTKFNRVLDQGYFDFTPQDIYKFYGLCLEHNREGILRSEKGLNEFNKKLSYYYDKYPNTEIIKSIKSSIESCSKNKDNMDWVRTLKMLIDVNVFNVLRWYGDVIPGVNSKDLPKLNY